MGNTIKILLGVACLAGVFGWAIAKYNFQEKQRVAVEAERQTIETERRKLADYFAGIVRTSDALEVREEVADHRRSSKRYTGQAWFARVADVLANGTYEPHSMALMVAVPYYQFYRNGTESLSLMFLGRGSLRFSGTRISGDFLVDEATVDALRALIAEKAL